MASVVSLDANFADFATLSASGKLSTVGFGTLEQGQMKEAERYSTV